jgi:hypothetical protein
VGRPSGHWAGIPPGCWKRGAPRVLIVSEKLPEANQDELKMDIVCVCGCV